MSRLEPFHPKDMSPEQRAYYDSISSRPNFRDLPEGTPLTGPCHAWQHAPAYAEKLGVLEQYLRVHGLLEPRLIELAAITVGRIWSAEIVFGSHAPVAVKVGIDSEIVEAIRHRKTPVFAKKDEEAVYNFVHRLTTEHEVDDATYQAALDVLGEAKLMELIGIAGLYVTASMTLNAFRIPVRPGMARPYPDRQS